LLSSPPAPGFAAHDAHWGPPGGAPDLIAEVQRAGLRGRGGAGFPTATKMAAVVQSVQRSGRRPVVIANATEGEPLSAKDRTLLERNPYLVVDGMLAAARAVGANRAILCVAGRPGASALATREMLDERRHRDVALDVVVTPDRYLAGEESALVNWLDNGRLLPTTTPPRPAERGVGGCPTLVDNVETLANVALIDRFGAGWWREVGTPDEAGTALMTVTGGIARPGVYEVAIGSTVDRLLHAAGAEPASGYLVGGYFGTWLPAGAGRTAVLSREGLTPFGAALGCGVLSVMPTDCCPVREVARVARWLALQSAGQCGPCLNGLGAIGSALQGIADGHDTRPQLDRWTAMVRGRGACKLPDGAASFVRSALGVFADHFAEHAAGRCPATADRPVLTPEIGAR
jgi:NADH:ubiquinone oxidoreductase subunit F (NADH-binding)